MFLGGIPFRCAFIFSSCLLSDNGAMYDLEAVLIHRGPTAYSGHYVAHIRSHGDGGVWFKFNDEEIQKMEGKNLKLGCEDELCECFISFC